MAAASVAPGVIPHPTLRCRPRSPTLSGRRHGDSLTSGWVQFLELLVVLYRQGILPDSFTRALDGDGEVRFLWVGVGAPRLCEHWRVTSPLCWCWCWWGCAGRAVGA